MLSLTPKQVIARDMMPAYRHFLLKGGSRSGKTFLLTRSCVVRALRAPESRHIIFRHRGNAAHASLWLDTIPKVLKACWPQLKVKNHEKDQYITLPNGSELWVAGLDDKERVEKVLGNEYCMHPDSKVLTSDLRWVPARTISVGDELIGFPEDLEGHQRLIRSTVTRANVVQAKRLRIVTNKGETIVSDNHKFVGYRDDRRTKNFRSLSWTEAKDLAVGDSIRYAAAPWESGESYSDGWLAGVLDGEGWCGRQSSCGVAQNEGLVLDALTQAFTDRGISFTRNKQAGSGPNSTKTCYNLKPNSMWDSMRLMGIARPKRLMPRTHLLWENRRGFNGMGGPGGHGTGKTQKAQEDGKHVATVISIERIEDGPVISLGTTSRTLIADGFPSHNCTVYFNECSQIKYSSVVLTHTRLAQKCEGLKNRAYYDINPVGKSHWTYKLFVEGVDPDTNRKRNDAHEFGYYRINPRDNAHNLDSAYISGLEALTGKARQRFLEGEDQDDSEGQLWTVEMLENCRVERAPADLRRVVVAVDPSGARGDFDSRDAIGIVAAGLGKDGNAYVLRDSTIRDRPEKWGRVVVNTYRDLCADRVLGEANFGGDMVRSTIHAVDPDIPFSATTSSKGKFLRAEPISALHEQGRIKFVGEFKELEDELQQFSQNGFMGEKSPNRADAFVFAITELLVKLGETPVWPMAFEQITCDPFPIPGEWLRIYAVTADRECDTIWSALDPDSDVLYLTNEYSSIDPNPILHASAIKKVHKDWNMPGLLSTGSKSPDELRSIWSQYKAEGISLSQVVEADNSVNAVWARIKDGRFKVFSNLSRFKQQYERYHRKRTETTSGEVNVIVEREDGLMLATRAVVAAGRQMMRIKPGCGPDAESAPVFTGGWMG